MANENINSGKRLQELSGSGYEIVDGEPDIRGWDVTDTQGKTIGEVDELIFDIQSRKVRYMVLDLDNNDFNLKSRKVLVPIGTAELHEKDDDVILPQITAAQLEALPEYNKESILGETETSIRDTLSGPSSLSAATAGIFGTPSTESDDFYNHEHFNERNLYKNRGTAENATSIPIIEEELQVGKKVVETGGARVRSTIVETPVQETVNLREEHVTVERNPVNRPATEADLAALGETQIELKEHAEVPVVSKEARVVEEVSLGKEVQEREETVRETVRKTEVDVENLDKGTQQTDRGSDITDTGDTYRKDTTSGNL